MKKMFLLGCAGRGVQPSSLTKPVSDKELPIMEQFRLQKESGLWDFVDRIPVGAAELDEYINASQKYSLPIYSGSWTYTLGADEQRIRDNIDQTLAVGATYHNLMVWAKHADGHYITDEEVATSYLNAYEYAHKRGVIITYENHVDMWSEDPRRVSKVANLVERHGIPFNICMDYSHCIFKVENEVEIAVAQLRGDQDGIRRLDPFNDDSYADEWLARNTVHWAQVRPAVPNGPRNWWAGETGPWDGLGYDRPGRSIQYPFSNPKLGEWHTDFWHAHKLASTKELIRKVIDSYITDENSELRLMTIDNINLAAYGTGWKYDMFADSCLVAQFVRETYAERMAVHQAKKQQGASFVTQYRNQV